MSVMNSVDKYSGPNTVRLFIESVESTGEGNDSVDRRVRRWYNEGWKAKITFLLLILNYPLVFL
jgi:hypothetical protein